MKGRAIHHKATFQTIQTSCAFFANATEDGHIGSIEMSLLFKWGNEMYTLTFCFPFHVLPNPETCTNCS
jgi:hypothetical protein